MLEIKRKIREFAQKGDWEQYQSLSQKRVQGCFPAGVWGKGRNELRPYI